MRQDEVRAGVLRDVEAGESYSIEGLRRLVRDWEGTWRRCLPEHEPDDFATSEQMEFAARDREARGHLEVTDEDHQELYRYWYYMQELRTLEAIDREAGDHLGAS